jgi:photosystem II stability/assembly factor-like uncharacterized protein
MVVYVTQDGGITWAATDPIPGGRSLAAVSPELWMATTASGQLAVTHDGRTYSLVPTDTDLSTATELSFADELHGLGILALSSGGSELVRTEDGGRHWQIVTLGG